MKTDEQAPFLVSRNFGDLNVECETTERKNKFTERNRRRLTQFLAKLNNYNFNGVHFSGFNVERVKPLASYYEVKITYENDSEIPDSFREAIKSFCPGITLSSYQKYDIAYLPYPIKPKFGNIIRRYIWLLIIVVGMFAFTCYKLWSEYELEITVKITRLYCDILSIAES